MPTKQLIYTSQHLITIMFRNALLNIKILGDVFNIYDNDMALNCAIETNKHNTHFAFNGRISDLENKDIDIFLSIWFGNNIVTIYIASIK